MAPITPRSLPSSSSSSSTLDYRGITVLFGFVAAALVSILALYVSYRLLRKVCSWLESKAEQELEDLEAQVTNTCPTIAELTMPLASRQTKVEARVRDVQRFSESPPNNVNYEKVVPTRRSYSIQSVHPQAARTFAERPPSVNNNAAHSGSPRIGSSSLLFYRSSVPARATPLPPPQPIIFRQMVDWSSVADRVVGAHPDAIALQARSVPRADHGQVDYPWVSQDMVFGFVHTIDTCPPPLSPKKPKKVMREIKNTRGVKWGTVSYTLGAIKDGKRTAGGKENAPIPAAMMV